MGPLKSPQRRNAVHELVVDATAKGARAAAGGYLPSGRGFYYPATVLADVPGSAAVLHEEPFGPIAPFQRCVDLDHGVAMANASPYALAAYLFGDQSSLERISPRLRAGSVGLNVISGAVPDAPLGGRGWSGYGYEGGIEGVREFTRVKVERW